VPASFCHRIALAHALDGGQADDLSALLSDCHDLTPE
jgi:hypothetical protein